MRALSVFLDYKGRKTNTKTLCDLILSELNVNDQLIMDINQ
jgi:hypothetical protein